jgi:hypothetical protein
VDYTKQTWANGSGGSTPLSAARLDVIEKGIQDAANASTGTAPLDSFAGADDEAKLTAGMSYAGAQTHPPVLTWTNRASAYDYTIARETYDGFRIMGANYGITNAELTDDNMVTKVQVNTNGTWLNVTGGGDRWNNLISGATFIGTANTTFLAGDSSTVWHGSQMRDVSFKNFKTIIGTQAQKMLMTTCLINGYFQVQGTYNGWFHAGGSDNRLFLDGALTDASQAYNTAGSATGQFFFWFDGMDNTKVGELYITCTGLWGGVKVTGVQYNATPTSNFGMLTFGSGLIVEGHNATDPCFGSVMRVEGGLVKVRDVYVGRAMSNPSAMGHSPQDAGVIHVTGGYLLLDGCTYGRATSVAETVPMVYQSGGNVRVLNASVATHGGTWSGLPRVTSTGGTINTSDGTWTLV